MLKNHGTEILPNKDAFLYALRVKSSSQLSFTGDHLYVRDPHYPWCLMFNNVCVSVRADERSGKVLLTTPAK